MHKKFSLLKIAMLVLVFSSTAALTGLSDILKSGTVKIAVPEAFPPFGSGGEHEGYDVDVVKLVAKDLRVKLEFVPIVNVIILVRNIQCD